MRATDLQEWTNTGIILIFKNMATASKNCSRAGGVCFSAPAGNKSFPRIAKGKHLALLVFTLFAVSMPAYTALAWSWPSLGGFVEKAAYKLVYVVVYVLASIGLFFASWFVKIGAWLVDVMLEGGLYSTLLNVQDPNSPVMIGWTTVRDMCNMFFVFFLLLIAFATIFRFQEYSAKNLLPKFIIAVFLINFSAVIAGVIIDFGQIFMYAIRDWMGTFSGNDGAMGSLTSIADAFRNQYSVANPPKGGYNLQNMVGAAFAFIFVFVMGCIYIMLAGFLLIRLIMFAILIILSPIAFFGIVLPSTRGYAHEWWQKIFSYSLFGPLFMFFVYLASVMGNSLVGRIPATDLSTDVKNGLGGIISNILPYTVSMAMLYAVIPLTQRLGIAGTDRLIGSTMGVGKIAMGTYVGLKMAGRGAYKAASAVDKRTGARVSSWGRKQKERVVKHIPIVGKDMVLKNRAEVERQREAKEKEMEIKFGDLKNIDLKLLEEKASGRLGTTEDKALLLRAAAAQGKLGDPKYAKYMVEAERVLSRKTLEEITSKNLNLATETSEGRRKVAEKTAEYLDRYPEYSQKEAEKKAKEEVMKEKMADIIREGKAHEVQGLDDPMSARVWHEAQTSDQRKSSMSRMAEDQRMLLQKGYLANTSDSPADIEKDREYRINAVKVGADLEEAFTKGGRVLKEDIEKAFADFSAKEIAKFKPEQLRKYGYSATASQIRALNREGEQEKVGFIRESKEAQLEGLKQVEDVSNFIRSRAELEREKGKKEKDQDKNKIKRLEEQVENLKKNKEVKEFVTLEKHIENIDSMLTGDKY